MAEWGAGGLRYSTGGPAVKWTRGGIRFEYKATKWDPHKHPRDRHGRFIRTGGHVRLSSGVVGEVTGTSGGKVHVSAGGKDHVVNAHEVTVVGGRAAAAAKPSAPKSPAAPKKPPKPKPKAAPGLAGEFRVDIADSQRKNIAAQFSTGDYSATVKEAATRLGAKQGLTAEHAEALAAAVREAADNPDLPAARSRSLHRGAERLDTVAAHLQGIRAEHKPSQNDVKKIDVPDIQEGDMVALPGRGGTADVRKVVASRPWYRLYEVTLEDANGNQETRYLTPETDAYLLPDLPDPDPLPPDPKNPPREWILAGRLNPGDVVEVNGERRMVESVTESGPLAWRVKFDDGNRPRRLASGLGYPNILRVERGAASESQPWDGALPPENPTTVTATELKPGDWIRVPGYDEDVLGVIDSISNGDERATARVLYVRGISGEVNPVAVGRSEEITRLSEGGSAEDVAAQIEREKAAAATRMTSAHLAHAFAATDRRFRQIAQEIARQEVSFRGGRDTPEELAADVRALLENRMGRPGNRQTDLSTSFGSDVIDAARWLAPSTEGADMAPYIDRLTEVFTEVADRAHADAIEKAVETVRNARPTSGDYDVNMEFTPRETYADAAYAALSGLVTDTRPDFHRAATTLAEFHQKLDGDESGGDIGVPEVPVPTDGDLSARMEEYRNALGGQFGKQRSQQQVFTKTTLADLEAGKVPDVETVDSFAAEKRAADGGPGEHTMAHLAIVRAAGKELDAELRRRIDADMKAWEKELDRIRADEANIRKDNNRLTHAVDEAQNRDADTFAQKHGFASFEALDIAWRRTGWGNSEWKRLKTLRQKARAYRTAKTKKLEQEQAAVLEKLMAIRTPGRVEKKRLGAAQRKHTIDLLDEIRKTGMGKAEGMTYLNEKGTPRTDRGKSGDLVKAMRYAEAGYPTDWLEKAKANLTLLEVNRGYYNNWDKKIALSKTSDQIGVDGTFGSVADHELGHHMEYNVPGLNAAEEALLWARTSTGKVGSRVREAKTTIYADTSEVGWKDDFPEHYTGKDYGGRAWEVFTTAKESLTSGSPYLDDDLRQWLLGVLALI